MYVEVLKRNAEHVSAVQPVKSFDGGVKPALVTNSFQICFNVQDTAPRPVMAAYNIESFCCMESSSSLDIFKSTPGKVPPVAFETGSLTLALRLTFGSQSRSSKPSCISDVSVRPSSSAFFLALLSNVSGSRTVILIFR